MESKKEIYVGLLGLGTVGTGVVKSLLANESHITHQTGYRVRVKAALVQTFEKERRVAVNPSFMTKDPSVILRDPEIDIVVEVMGGVEPALSYIRQALLLRKHVVTANKELLAKHGEELMRIAKEMGVRLLYEASVAGGIPIVRTLQAYLTANRVSSIRGILNGTSNYILTQMQLEHVTFTEALLEAQQLGYAEADPTSDVEGYDAAYKLLILANMAFPVRAEMAFVRRIGISKISPIDFEYATRLNCTIKLIGEASYDGECVHLEVTPKLLSRTDALATVNDVFNAVTISADVVGELTFIGRGAGEMPTASAVIEDIAEILRSPKPPLVRQQEIGMDGWIKGNAIKQGMYYVRMQFSHLCQDQVLGVDGKTRFESVASAVEIGSGEGGLTRVFLVAGADLEQIVHIAECLQVKFYVILPYEGEFVLPEHSEFFTLPAV